MAATDIQTALAEQRKTREQQSWWNILKTSGSEWVDADAMTWAAAIACYTVLALAPLLVVAVKLFTVLLRDQANAVQKIQDNATSWLGPDGAKAIAAILEKVVEQKGGLMAAIISGLLVIVSVGGVFSEFQQAMNRVWKVKPKAGRGLMTFIGARLKSVVVLAIAALLLLASVAVAGWLNHLTSQFGMGWKFLSWSVDFIATLVALTLIFGMVFKTVPDAEIEWKSTILGAVITALLFALGKYGLALYFKFAAPTSAFGAVGSLAAVLIWIYYSAQIALFGAEFTQVYARTRGHGVRPSKHAEFLSECDETETATPSPEEPGKKPARGEAAGSPETQSDSEDDYATVLGQHAPASQASTPRRAATSVREQRATPNLLVATASLAAGALLGGLGALQLRTRNHVRGRDVAAVGLDRRMKGVEQKLGHVSRIKEYLEQENVNERIDAVERHIRQAARDSRRVARRRGSETWTDRIVGAVKSIL